MLRLEEKFDNGKYTVIFEEKGSMKALRYGEEWRDLTGDGMVLSMLHEVNRLREVVNEVHLLVLEDMAQNFERICEITDPDYQGEL